MAEDNKQDIKKQQETEATKNAAVNAAKMYGGPVGLGVNLASKTKLGNAVLNKGAEQLNKQNPGLGKLTSAINRGNSDLIKGKNNSDLASSNDAGLPKDGLDNTTPDADVSNENLGNTEKKSVFDRLKKGLSFGNGFADTEAEVSYSDKIFSVLKKHWKVCVGILGGLLTPFCPVAGPALIGVAVGSGVPGVVNTSVGIGKCIDAEIQKSNLKKDKNNE